MAQNDDFGKHEVLDRSHIIQTMWDEFIMQHGAVQDDTDLNFRAEQIGALLVEFYMLAGSKFL